MLKTITKGVFFFMDRLIDTEGLSHTFFTLFSTLVCSMGFYVSLKKQSVDSVKDHHWLTIYTNNCLYTIVDQLIIHTLSCRLYHLGDESSATICPAIGNITSPKKSFLPNMSECQTLIHNVLRSISSKGMWN